MIMKGKAKLPDRSIPKRPGYVKTANEFKLCTWNLRSLHRSAGLRLLYQQLQQHRADITALQEMRWTGQGVIDKPEFCVYYSCHKKQHIFGTGFIVSKKLKHLIIDFKAINERMCTIRVKGRFHNFTFINVHAPTEDTEDEEKEQWYHELENIYIKAPKGDVKVILGDFNAKVGREGIYRPIIGSHSLHDTCNDNGTRLVNLASSLNMIIGSTCFPHKNIHKITWISPDGYTKNQIDHVLIDSRHFSNLLDVRTHRGANIDSDHHLVVCKIRARISRYKYGKTVKITKFNTDLLKKDKNTHFKYVDTICRLLTYENEVREDSENVDQHWGRLKNILYKAGEETLGMQDKNRRSDWFDSECQEATDRKNVAWHNMMASSTRRKKEIYKSLRRQEKQVHKKKKKASEKQELEELSTEYNRKETRKFYGRINKGRKKFKPKTVACKNEQGDILNDKQQILERWAEHFKKLLNSTNPQAYPSEMCKDAIDDETLLPTLEDVEQAIQRLRNNKSPGCDNIPGELFKYGGLRLYKEIHSLIEQIWKSESMPEEWKTAIISPLHKKGDVLECANYRGISLLNVAYKIFANVLYDKLVQYAEPTLGEFQCGFRPNRSTTDQLFCLRQILEKTREFNVDTHHLFIDFKAAYDSVHRNFLFQAMKDINIPPKLISLTKMTLDETECMVRIQADHSDAFRVNEGLRQGDALSCLLFNIVLDKCVQDSKIEKEGTIFYKSIQVLGYADDLDLVGRSRQTLDNAYLSLESATQAAGLRINQEKTKYMPVLRDQQTLLEENIKIGANTFATVRDFIYLGSLITSENENSAEIQRRITLANKCYFGMLRYLRSKILSRHLKVLLYKTLLRPILIYGAECWVLSKKDENSLLIFERKVLRRIYGAVQDNGVWRIRYNHELYELFKEPNVVRTIKLSRMRWAGHVQRMDNTRAPKKLLESKPEGRRGRGRPRGRWIDGVERDVRVLGVRSWKEAASDRPRWRTLLDQAKAHSGL